MTNFFRPEDTNAAARQMGQVADGVQAAGDTHLPQIEAGIAQVNAEAGGHPASETSDIRGKLAPMLATMVDHVRTSISGIHENIDTSFTNGRAATDTRSEHDARGAEALGRIGSNVTDARGRA